MCGINGFIDPKLGSEEAKKVLDRMLWSTHHRGPDHTGRWHKDDVHLGHNRLSIIDLSEEANQPFQRDELIMIHNGEVYNYLEIRQELEKIGHLFRTKSDTEVILAAFQEWGKDCVSRFVGMWAFVIYDTRDKSLFASRDRFGIKPLHYIKEGERFYFSSEMKALRSSPLFKKEVNERQVALGLQLGMLSHGDESYYQQVKNLKPGHNLSLKDGQIRTWQYWDVRLFQVDDRPYDEKVGSFRELFMDSVKLHLRSDVPLGTCLSGGLDSSSIASAVSKLSPGQEFHTFSIYYEKEGFDERRWMKAVEEKYPQIIPHHYSPSDDELIDHFEDFFEQQDVPMAGSSPFSQYFLMRLAKQCGVTVTLDGQGADEYLIGYMHSFFRILADDIRGFRWGKAKREYTAHSALRGFSGADATQLLKKTMASVLYSERGLAELAFKKAQPWVMRNDHQADEPEVRGSRTRIDGFLHGLTFHSTLPTLLHYADRNSMRFSLESRVPYLDHRLVEAGFALKVEDRVKDGVTKRILRDAMKGIIPDAIYHRQDKKAFNTPGEVKWLRGPMAHMLDFSDATYDLVDRKKVDGLVQEFKAGSDRHAKMIWRLAMLDHWLKK